MRLLSSAAVTPTNTVAPAVTGTAQVGNSLTTTNGTWSNAFSYSQEWFSNTVSSTSGGTLLAGDTNLTSVFLDSSLSGLYIFSKIIANGGGGLQGFAFSNIAGPVAAATGLTAPTLTLTSATGATPEWDTAIGADTYAGYYLHIEASADGIKGGDGTYTTVTQAIDHFITPSDIASGIISHAELVADGWADPGGAWFLHCWVFREDGVKSGISNELSGTVTGSAAVLATTTGANKSQYVNVTGTPPLSAAGNANTGAYDGVRSSIGKTGKGHFEVTLTGGSSGDTIGSVWFGVTDASTIDMNAAHTIPGGAAGAPGCAFRMKVTSPNNIPFLNGAQQSNNALEAVTAVGDIYAVEFDTATGIVKVYQRPVSTGVWGPAHSFTMSTQVPSAPYFAHIGLGYADASCTVNFGATAFSMTPSTGYSGW